LGQGEKKQILAISIDMWDPYIKAICLGRATMTAAMVGNTIGQMIKIYEGVKEKLSGR
jgi:putative Mn2+ efflux pump MntP